MVSLASFGITLVTQLWAGHQGHFWISLTEVERPTLSEKGFVLARGLIIHCGREACWQSVTLRQVRQYEGTVDGVVPWVGSQTQERRSKSAEHKLNLFLYCLT